MSVLKKNTDGSCEIPAFRFKQNGKEMITFVIKHQDLIRFYFIEQFDEKNLKGNQRRLYDDHVLRFAEAMQEHNAQRPQSIVGTLCGGARFKEKTPGFGTLVLPKTEGGKFISIQDGQHSLSALDYVDDKKKNGWEWTVTAYESGDWRDRTSVHLSINAHQKKVDKSHLLHQSINIDDPAMDATDKRAGRMIIKMDKDEECVFMNRVKLYDAQNKKLSLSVLLSHLAPVLRIEEVDKLTDTQIYDLIKGYFNEWRNQNKEIWEDQGNFFMSTILGIKVLSRFMSEVIKVLVAKNKVLTQEHMGSIIERAKTYQMNWSKTALLQENGHQIEAYLLEQLIKKTGTYKVLRK